MLWPQCHELWKKSQSLSEQHRHHLNTCGWCRSKKMPLMLWRLRESLAIGCSYNFGWLYCRYQYKWKGNRLQICKIKIMDEGALECWIRVGWVRWAVECWTWIWWVRWGELWNIEVGRVGWNKLTYPAAQLPLSLPPLSEHSVEVKQVPFLESLADLQSKFWKVTMENKLNSEKFKIVIWDFQTWCIIVIWMKLTFRAFGLCFGSIFNFRCQRSCK